VSIVVLFANPEYAHVAFKVASLADLKSLYARVLQKGIPIKFVFNHGVSFSFYFDDPVAVSTVGRNVMVLPPFG
jgi:hypothetical protein